MMNGTDQVLVWRHGQPVRRGDVRAAAGLLAGDLAGDSGAIINLCADRLWFITALLAAGHSGRRTILPPSTAPRVVEQLAQRNGGARILDDDGVSAVATGDGAYRRSGNAVGQHQPQPSLSLFTSGSTGRPTEHARSWQQLMEGAEALGAALGIENTAYNFLATVPAQHMFGLESTIMLPLAGPHAVEAGRPLFPEDVRRSLYELPEPRGLVTTPFHLRRCLDTGLLFPTVRFILSATAPMDVALADRAETAFGGELREIFGSTETGALATRRTSRERAWRLLPGTTLYRSGDSWAASGRHFPETTLGDAFTVYPDGRFNHDGRAGDMIKIAGKRGSLAEVTRALTSLDGVEDALVLPRDIEPDRTRLMAIVVAPDVGVSRIRRQLRDRIDAAFVPRPVIHARQLPRNAVGKITDAALHTLLDELGIEP